MGEWWCCVGGQGNWHWLVEAGVERGRLGGRLLLLLGAKLPCSTPVAVATVVMRICDSEENRRKLAWLVPGYILLAWFFCVVFQVDNCSLSCYSLISHHQNSCHQQQIISKISQPLGLTSMPGHGNNNDYNDESLYEIINLQDDPQVRVQTQLRIVHGPQ